MLWGTGHYALFLFKRVKPSLRRTIGVALAAQFAAISREQWCAGS